MYVKAFDKLRADLSQQLADSAPLTGERMAKRMAAMAPSISSMQKMAIGALEAMDNANRLQQMEEEKAQMEDKMRERESSLKKQMAEEKQQMQQLLLGDYAAVTQALIDTIGLYSNRNGFYHRVFYCKTTNLPRPQSDQYGKQRKMANAFATRDTYRPSEDTRLQAACGNGGAAQQTTGRFCRCAARAVRAGWDRGQAAHSSCIRGESHIHPQREAEHVGVACRAACDGDGVGFR